MRLSEAQAEQRYAREIQDDQCQVRPAKSH
jgi:hypothetical protein